MALGRMYIIIGCLLFSFGILIFTARPLLPERLQYFSPKLSTEKPAAAAPKRPWFKPPIPTTALGASCRGPRGNAIDDPLSQDVPHPISNELLDGHSGNIQFPEPAYGSYDTLGLEKTWMTFDERYGPYGYRENENDYGFKTVDWSTVNWAHLQDQCLLSQPNRTHGEDFLQSSAPPRFRLAHEAQLDNPPLKDTGRQAIVLRTWETYDYAPEDLWNIRSIIAEAGLATNGEIAVFLLVDVKREDGARIHTDDAYYRQVLEESVPREFWDIAVLFHMSLQKSWYPNIVEYRAFWQIMQPLQLFATFYPEFDHFWQIEMDVRFTGHVGKLLQAFHRFGKDQPYKQSRERASWTYMPGVHGTYEEFSASVNKSLKGSATIWGPIDIGVRKFNPVGPIPPVRDPKDDNFEWLAGEDADLLTYGAVFEVLRFATFEDWNFKTWIGGIDKSVPRFGSVPAQARASRRLLQAAHAGQHELGLKVHSEATLPTFAMWNGLKVVQVPMPKFQFPERDLTELSMIYNGGGPSEVEDGIANGPAPYKHTMVDFYARPRTFDWRSSLANPVFKHWKNRKSRRDISKTLAKRQRATLGDIPDELPSFMREVNGQVYAPSFMMHPRKTNHGADDSA